MEEKLSAPYKKTCNECKKVGHVPNGQVDCLECLSSKLNLESWETICLQCGKKTSGLTGGNKFCWDCLGTNSENFGKEFVATLSDEQLALFEKYEAWDGARTSAIMLD